MWVDKHVQLQSACITMQNNIHTGAGGPLPCTEALYTGFETCIKTCVDMPVCTDMCFTMHLGTCIHSSIHIPMRMLIRRTHPIAVLLLSTSAEASRLHGARMWCVAMGSDTSDAPILPHLAALPAYHCPSHHCLCGQGGSVWVSVHTPTPTPIPIHTHARSHAQRCGMMADRQTDRQTDRRARARTAAPWLTALCPC